jgi:hypothetical protein
MYGPPKDINFDPNKNLGGMIKGSKEIAKYLKKRTKK